MRYFKSNLRMRTVVTIGVTTLILTLVLTWLARTILVKSYLDLEQEQVKQNVTLIKTVINNQLVELDSKTGDWGAWNDTYQYMADQNEAYIQNNFSDESIKTLDINLCILVSTEGKVLYAKEYDSITQSEHKPSINLQNFINQNSQLLYFKKLKENNHGLVFFDNQLLFLSTHAIVDSGYTSPSRGAIIMARYLNENFKEKFKPINNNSKLFLAPYNREDVKSKNSQIIFEEKIDEIYVIPSNEKDVLGLGVYADIRGAPALLISYSEPRVIYQQGERTLGYLSVLLLLSNLFLGLMILHSLDVQVLSRLEIISEGISKVAKRGDLSVRFKLSGNDELSNLAEQLNHTFGALQHSTKALIENEEKLIYDATHDTLTGFSNRSFLQQRLIDLAKTIGDEHESVTAVLFIDLDRFKLVNDSFNHDVGDKILIEFGQRLKKRFRSYDLLARLGGDEFAILIERATHKNEIVRMAERIQNDLLQPFEIEERKIFVSASIGIAYFTPETKPEELLRNSELAMYRAKENGKACFAVYDEDLRSYSLTRLQAETEIRQAIDRREFLVYYQPVVSLQTGRIVSLEALARWRHPIRGLIAPNKFIPIAEETGLIFPISEIIFEKAFMQLRSWLDAGFEDLSMSVNVSARHLQDKSLPSLISGYLSQAGLSGHNISLEITESAMMLDLEQSLLVLGELRELGVQISIDDFGTGYSSLAYLKRLAANSIKIDKAFIKDVVENSDDATIVSAIVAMGHVLSMDVVAEGVENREQIRFLKRQFCEKAQGFFFSRPVPPEYITEVLISGYIYPIEDTNVA